MLGFMVQVLPKDERTGIGTSQVFRTSHLSVQVGVGKATEEGGFLQTQGLQFREISVPKDNLPFAWADVGMRLLQALHDR
jgi:hypothetical protein